MIITRRATIAGVLAAAAPSVVARAAIAAPAAPVIPPRTLAAGDIGLREGSNTAALQSALDRASAQGGGTVEVPAGRFVTGTLFLKPGTRLYLSQGAELVGSDDLAEYPHRRVRWEGKWVDGHCSLLQAEGADDIAIAGPGKITGSDKVGGMPRPDYPYRHPALIEPVNCRRVLLEGFSTSYDHMWNIHPTLCDDITVRRLTIRSSAKGRDGIDVDSCRRVRIENCDIATGDDCISLKSGRGMEGLSQGRPTEDVVITGCTFADWNWACIGIGSEMSGGIRGVKIDHCRFVQAKTHAIYLKGQVGRGGYVEDISVEDGDISGCGLGAIRINFLNSGKKDEQQVPGDAGIPRVAEFRFARLRVHDVPQLVEGREIDPAKPLDGLTLEDITGTSAKGIHLAHVRRASIARVRLDGLSEPLLSLDDVTPDHFKE